MGRGSKLKTEGRWEGQGHANREQRAGGGARGRHSKLTTEGWPS